MYCFRKAAIFAGVALAFALALGPGIGSSALAAPCHLVRYGQAPISGENGYLILLPVTIDGHKAKFMVDTGGIYSTISKYAVRALGLHPQSYETGIFGADGRRFDKVVVVNEFGMGSVVSKHAILLIQPIHSTTGINHFDGTIAPGLLRNFDLDFDFGGGQFNLFGQNDCGARAVYWSRKAGSVDFRLRNNHVVVPVTIDGETMRAIIDTGASGTLLSEGEARRRFGLKPGDPGLEPVKGAKPDDLVQYTHAFKSLTIGDVTVQNPQIGILSDDMKKAIGQRYGGSASGSPYLFADTHDIPEVTIGLDVLSRMHIYIAYRARTIYVTPASAGHNGIAAYRHTAVWSAGN